MDSAEIKTDKSKTGVRVIDEMVSLAESFDIAVAQRNEKLTSLLLEQICIRVQEVQHKKTGAALSNFFANQAYLLHVHNVEAMDCMNMHRGIPPNWGGVNAHGQVIRGYVNEMRIIALKEMLQVEVLEKLWNAPV